MMNSAGVTFSLMDAAQFFNIYDFNFLFLNATIGWDAAKVFLRTEIMHKMHKNEDHYLLVFS